MFSLFKKKEVDNNLYAPVDGRIIPLEEVPDEVFAKKMMGEGVAYQFDGDTVYAPCDGTILMFAKTKHAFGIKMDNGAEVLVHIGMDTVNLNGMGLEVLQEENKKVTRGTPMIKINRSLMKEKHIDLTTPIVITNSEEFNVNFIDIFELVKVGDIFITLYKK